jgi:predicted pyridoxine 5'-phosphate oxidase superfamily flavin-nucleotide-binding protein
MRRSDVTGDPRPPSSPDRPGSHGEHLLQTLFGTYDRAANFYDKQVLDHLNSRMRKFIDRQEMAFVATADAKGECDCTFRAGPPGFIKVIDDHMIAYPEYRGNGVMASLGNMVENAHVGVLMVDFFEDLVGLHVNGRARIVTSGTAASFGLVEDPDRPPGRSAERWVTVRVDEAYIHCSKNIPLLRCEDRRARVADRAVRPAGSAYFTGESRRSDDESAEDQAYFPVSAGPRGRGR